MTEEQRWKQQYQLELDRNKCLKGIWDDLKDLKNLKKIEMGALPIVNSCRSVEELDQLVSAIANPTRFMEGCESNADDESI
jgi:hypothetical protein